MPRFTAFSSSAVLVLAAASVLAMEASAQSIQPRRPIAVSSGYFSSMKKVTGYTSSNKLPGSTSSAAQNQDPRIVSVPTFTRSFTYNKVAYPYTMVGQQPSSQTTTVVPTQYVPLSFFFDEYVDQNGNNITIDATAISNEIRNSPLFQPSSYATGFTQFVDAQMRAEFYNLFNSGFGPSLFGGFHVLLGQPSTLIPVSIEVPVGSAVVFVDPNGNYFALMDINFIVSQLNTLAQTEPINVYSLPIFLTRNAVYGDFNAGAPLDCCIGGFHTAFQTNQTANQIFIQLFAFATSLDPDVAAAIFGDPAVFADVNALSHEIAETLNDPFINNITPNYQLPGAPAGTCQNNLEVGDVVENLMPDYTTITMNGFSYHPQTLGLLQWFEGISPSNAINGDYSFPDPTKLRSPFTPCPTATSAAH